MTQVKDDSPLSGLSDRFPNATVAIEWCIREWTETVSQHIPGAQVVQNIIPIRWRKIYMGHQRQTRLLTNLPGDLEWRHTSAATCVASNPHLDPNDAIPVLLNGFQALVSIE